jgi:hypothetical protein
MPEHDVSRRDFLKRGALLGGALVWTTPVVQVVGMNPALAQVASPTCAFWYAVKIERETDGSCPPDFTIIPPSPTSTNDGCCTDITGGNNPPGQCLNADDAPPDGKTLNSGGCTHIQWVEIPDEGETDTAWLVKLDDDCQFVPDTGRCTVKIGGKDREDEGCISDACSYDHESRTLTFTSPGGDISHVEFAFCCDN